MVIIVWMDGVFDVLMVGVLQFCEASILWHCQEHSFAYILRSTFPRIRHESEFIEQWLGTGETDFF